MTTKHKRLRQTHLGRKDVNGLGVIDAELPMDSPLLYHNAWTHSMIDTDKSYMSRLPEELLVSIIEFATDHAQYATAFDTACVMALSRVCQTFRRLAQPLLYHDIHFDQNFTLKTTLEYPYIDPMVPPTKRIVKFHRTLKENPALRKHCR